MIDAHGPNLALTPDVTKQQCADDHGQELPKKLPDAHPPEYRRDIISGRWVIIASERGSRPGALQPRPQLRTDPADCPFCTGREHLTPPEVLAVRPAGGAANGPGWTVRAIPNRYPAVRALPSEISDNTLVTDEICPGWGHHEVVVECPEHLVSATARPPEHWGDLFHVYRERARELLSTPPTRCIQIFKNGGLTAGATQEHAHSQILALLQIPPLLAEEVAGALAFWQTQRCCVFCQQGDRECDSARFVTDTPHFAAWCPFASRFPFEMCIAPRFHQHDFRWLNDDLLVEFGGLIRRLCLVLETLLPPAAYNYFLHTAPVEDVLAESFHWHWEITPRLLQLAGLEVGGGLMINPVPPEWAAKILRDTLTSL